MIVPKMDTFKETIVPKKETVNIKISKKKQNGSGWLFPNPETGKPYKDLRGTLAAAAKKSGYRGNITQHKFRHAYGTELIATGAATLRDVQILLGHSTSQITEIYTHLSTERLTAVTDRLKNR
jgi:site-specific recombinase XerD